MSYTQNADASNDALYSIYTGAGVYLARFEGDGLPYAMCRDDGGNFGFSEGAALAFERDEAARACVAVRRGGFPAWIVPADMAAGVRA